MTVNITKPTLGATSGWGTVLNTALDAIVTEVNVHATTLGNGTLGAGSRFGFLGDSLTEGGSAGLTWGVAWPTFLGLLSGGTIRPIIIDGFPGQRSDQILPYVSDILAAGVNACVVAFGTNDILQSIAPSVPLANIKAAVAQLRSAGIAPVLATLPPNNTSSAVRDGIAKLNAGIKQYAAAQRLPVLPFHGTLVDPATGQYASAYNNDGTHPNGAGYLAMAQAAWTVLGPLLPSASTQLTSWNNESTNRLNSANCVFLTDGNADGVPDNWTVYSLGASTGITHSLITGDTAIIGNWAQIAAATSASDRVLEYGASSISPGDKIVVTGRFGVTAYTSGNGASVKVTFTGASSGGTAFPLYQITRVVSGVYYQELTVPAGTTSVLFDFIVHSGTVTAKLAQPTVLNLTTLGIS